MTPHLSRKENSSDDSDEIGASYGGPRTFKHFVCINLLNLCIITRLRGMCYCCPSVMGGETEICDFTKATRPIPERGLESVPSAGLGAVGSQQAPQSTGEGAGGLPTRAAPG